MSYQERRDETNREAMDDLKSQISYIKGITFQLAAEG